MSMGQSLFKQTVMHLFDRYCPKTYAIFAMELDQVLLDHVELFRIAHDIVD